MALAGRVRAATLAAVAVRMVGATARPVPSAALMMVMVRGEDTEFGTVWWWAYAALSALLVLLAGIMSGLTLGLMSLGPVDLEILMRSGTDAEKAQAGKIPKHSPPPLRHKKRWAGRRRRGAGSCRRARRFGLD